MDKSEPRSSSTKTAPPQRRADDPGRLSWRRSNRSCANNENAMCPRASPLFAIGRLIGLRGSACRKPRGRHQAGGRAALAGVESVQRGHLVAESPEVAALSDEQKRVAGERESWDPPDADPPGPKIRLERNQNREAWTCALMVNRIGPTFRGDGHTAREAIRDALKQAGVELPN
jgi:hypothetical protein